MKLKLLYLSLLFIFFTGYAQNQDGTDDVFEDVSIKPKTGFLIAGNYQFVIPAASFKERFGISSMAGAGLFYKSKKNWIYGGEMNVMFGSKINENVAGNLVTSTGLVIGKDGYIAEINPQLRGFNMFFRVGKTINLTKKNKDAGIHLAAGYGFIQHKIKFENFIDDTPQLSGDYAKGYDRLTNGAYLVQSVSYLHLSSNKITNFQLGVEFGEGITKSRRDFNFDTMKKDTETRFDFLIGLKFSVFVPIYTSVKEEYFYF